MKLLLLICSAAAVAAASAADKPKREILPGDPRYGTDYHHHHQHVHDNEVQTVKAAGSYVGSFAVPNAEGRSQQTISSYGLPNYQSGTPLGLEYSANDATKSSVTFNQVPSTSYGIPDTLQNINKNYYLGPVEEKNPTVKTSNLNIDYQLPSVEAPISYAADVKHEEQNSFQTPVVKTTVNEQSKETHVQSNAAAVSEVRQQPTIVQKNLGTVPQVKVTSQSQGAYQRTNGNVFTLPTYSYTSYGTIPVKTVDRHVHVQVPQPYPVPITKHVTVSVPVPQPVEVPKPYYVRVPQPVRVTVNRPYPVEVPRPVPYTVPHYVRTSVPIHVTTYDAIKGNNPFDIFVENAQNFVPNFPDFSGFVDNFPNFPNFVPNFPGGFPSFFPPTQQPTQQPSPQQPTQQPTQTPSASQSDALFSSNTDGIAVENPTTKTEIAPKPTVLQSVKIQQTQETYKPSTACAGCSVTNVQPTKLSELAQPTKIESVQSTNQQEYVQPTDANGGYVY